MYRGDAEYETIRAIKAAVQIPVFANGDIDSPQKAQWVLEQTNVDGLMIGRSAQGRPWIFREIREFLSTGRVTTRASISEVRDIMRAHLRNLYIFYGEQVGVRVARKHIGWYAEGRANALAFRQVVMKTESASAQLDAVETYFDTLVTDEEAAHVD
jgi:tRNA-dihydrouridine synthase B